MKALFFLGVACIALFVGVANTSHADGHNEEFYYPRKLKSKLEELMEDYLKKWVTDLASKDEKRKYHFVSKFEIEMGGTFSAKNVYRRPKYLPIPIVDIQYRLDQVVWAYAPSEFIRRLKTEDALFAYAGIIARGINPTGPMNLSDPKFLEEITSKMILNKKNPYGYLNVLEARAQITNTEVDPSVIDWMKKHSGITEDQNQQTSLPTDLKYKSYLETKIETITKKLDLKKPIQLIWVDRSKWNRISPFFKTRENGYEFYLYLPENLEDVFETDDEFVAMVTYLLLWNEMTEEVRKINASKDAQALAVAAPEKIAEIDKKVIDELIRLSKETHLKYSPGSLSVLATRINNLENKKKKVRKQGGEFKFRGFFDTIRTSKLQLDPSLRLQEINRYTIEKKLPNLQIFDRKTPFLSDVVKKKSTYVADQKLIQKGDHSTEVVPEYIENGSMTFEKVLDHLGKFSDSYSLAEQAISMLREIPESQRTAWNFYLFLQKVSKESLKSSSPQESMIALVQKGTSFIESLEQIVLNPEVKNSTASLEFLKRLIQNSLRLTNNQTLYHRLHHVLSSPQLIKYVPDSDFLVTLYKGLIAENPKKRAEERIPPSRLILIGGISCSLVEDLTDLFIHAEYSRTEIAKWLGQYKDCRALLGPSPIGEYGKKLGKKLPMRHFDDLIEFIQAMNLNNEQAQSVSNEIVREGMKQIPASEITIENLKRIRDLAKKLPFTDASINFVFFNAINKTNHPVERDQIHQIWLETIPEGNGKLGNLYTREGEYRFQKQYLKLVEATLETDNSDLLLSFPLPFNNSNSLNRDLFNLLLDSDLDNHFIQKWISNKIAPSEQGYFLEKLAKERPTKSLQEIVTILTQIDPSYPQGVWNETKRLFKVISKEDLTRENVVRFLSHFPVQNLDGKDELQFYQVKLENAKATIIKLAILGQMLRYTKDQSTLVWLYDSIAPETNLKINRTFCNALSIHFRKMIESVNQEKPEVLATGFNPSSFVTNDGFTCSATLLSPNWHSMISEVLNESSQTLKSLAPILKASKSAKVASKLIAQLPESELTLNKIKEFEIEVGTHSTSTLFVYTRLLERAKTPAEFAVVHEYLTKYPKILDIGVRKKICPVVDDKFKEMLMTSSLEKPELLNKQFTPGSLGCWEKNEEIQKKYRKILIKVNRKYNLFNRNQYVQNALRNRRYEMEEVFGKHLEKTIKESVAANPPTILDFPIYTRPYFFNFNTLYSNDWYEDGFIKDQLIKNWQGEPHYLVAWLRYLPLGKRYPAMKRFIETRKISTVSEWISVLNQLKSPDLVQPWMSESEPQENIRTPLFTRKVLEKLFKHLNPAELTVKKLLPLLIQHGDLIDQNYLLGRLVLFDETDHATLVQLHHLLVKNNARADFYGFCQNSKYAENYIRLIDAVFTSGAATLIKPEEKNQLPVVEVKSNSLLQPIIEEKSESSSSADSSLSKVEAKAEATVEAEPIEPEKTVQIKSISRIQFYSYPLFNNQCFGSDPKKKNEILSQFAEIIIRNAKNWPSGLAWAWFQEFYPTYPVEQETQFPSGKWLMNQMFAPENKGLTIDQTTAIVKSAKAAGILNFSRIPQEIVNAQAIYSAFKLDANIQTQIFKELPADSYTLESLREYIALDDVWAKQGAGVSILNYNKGERGKTKFEEELERRTDEPELLKEYKKFAEEIKNNPITIYDLNNSEGLQKVFYSRIDLPKDLKAQHEILRDLAKRGPSEFTDDLIHQLYMREDFACAECIFETAKLRAFWGLDKRADIFFKYLRLTHLVEPIGPRVQDVKFVVKSDDEKDFYVMKDIFNLMNVFFPEDSLQRSEIFEKLANDVLANAKLTEIIESEKVRSSQGTITLGLYLVNNLLQQYPSPKERLAFVRFFAKNVPLPESIAYKIKQQIGVNRLRTQFLQLPAFAKATTLAAMISGNLLNDPKYLKKLEKLIWKNVEAENPEILDLSKLFYRSLMHAISETSPHEKGHFVGFLLGQLANVNGAPAGVKLKYILESLGGTGISIGQKVYQRQLIPEEYLVHLKDMTDHSPVPNRYEIYKRMQTLLGYKTFDELDQRMKLKEVLGGASTAVVVRVVIYGEKGKKKSGKNYALKITFENLKNKTSIEEQKMREALKYLVDRGGSEYRRLEPVIDEIISGLRGQENLLNEQNKTDEMKRLYETRDEQSNVRFKVIRSFPTLGDSPYPDNQFISGSEDHVFMELAKGKTLSRLTEAERKMIFPEIFKKEMNILLADAVNGVVTFEKDRHMGNFMVDIKEGKTPTVYVYDYPLMSVIHEKKRDSIFVLIGLMEYRKRANFAVGLAVDQAIANLLVKELSTKSGVIPVGDIRNGVSSVMLKNSGNSTVEKIFSLFSLLDEAGAKYSVTLDPDLTPYLVALGHAERYATSEDRKEGEEKPKLEESEFYQILKKRVEALMEKRYPDQFKKEHRNEEAPLLENNLDGPSFNPGFGQSLSIQDTKKP